MGAGGAGPSQHRRYCTFQGSNRARGHASGRAAGDVGRNGFRSLCPAPGHCWASEGIEKIGKTSKRPCRRLSFVLLLEAGETKDEERWVRCPWSATRISAAHW